MQQECCCPERSAGSDPMACPGCQVSGKPVETLTIKALLTASALQRFEPADYLFCTVPDCDLVYFAQGGPAFRTGDIQVRVWQKEPRGRRMLCYCFAENEADMTMEINRTGQSLAAHRIRRHIEARRCACEVRNPKGSCCLGDVTTVIDRLRARVADGS